MKSMREKSMMRSGGSRLFALALALAAAALPAWAQNAIQSINSSAAGGHRGRPHRAERAADRGAGRLHGPDAAARSRSTCPASPTRSASRRVEINQGNLRSVNVAQAGERTRLVLNLKQPASYRAQLDGKVLLRRARQHRAGAAGRGGQRRRAGALRREPEPRASCRCATSTSAAARTAPAASSSSLPNNQVGVDIRQQGQSLVVEFLRSSAARQPAPPPRRDRLRHAGAEHLDHPERRPRAHGGRAARRLGAQRLPERQPVRARGAAAEGRPEQAVAGRRATRARSCR